MAPKIIITFYFFVIDLDINGNNEISANKDGGNIYGFITEADELPCVCEMFLFNIMRPPSVVGKRQDPLLY